MKELKCGIMVRMENRLVGAVKEEFNVLANKINFPHFFISLL